MATRDENLKKINAELEQLSDDELEKVAGGTVTETANDSRFLNSLNGSCDRYGEWRIRNQDHDDEIRKAWETVGVKAEINTSFVFGQGKPNKYFIKGQQVTQEDARQHAMKVTGHFMTEKDWKW